MTDGPPQPAPAAALASQPPTGGAAGAAPQPRKGGALGGLDPATRRQTFMVAAILAAVFFGSQILNEAIPASANEARPGTPVDIASGATITPVEGWIISTFDDGSGIRLEKGVAVLDLFEQASPTGAELATLYLEQVLRPQSTELTASDTETATITGGSAARFTYQGLFAAAEGAIEGEVTAVVGAGRGVVGDGWAPQGRLGELLDEIHAMLATIEVGL